MTTPASPAADPRPSALATVFLWVWRLANTALLAAGIVILWRQATQLEHLNDQLSSLLDYLNVIAERLGR
jgi:hypothetical protein